jgi:hypothetical protein
MISSIALLAAAAVQPAPMAPMQPAVQGPLQLSCVGAGTANKTFTDTVRSDTKVHTAPGEQPKDKTHTTTVSRTVQQDFADQVDVSLFAGDDRIRVPRAMLPDLHGGKGGWFKLKNVVADDRSIKASTSLGPFSNPKIFIDRMTGIISISGNAGDYSGQCQVIDPNARPRF